MQLNLKRPIVFFDIETTGLDIVNDRIVEICLVKIFPDGNEETKTYKINPLKPIPEKASKIHGIYDEDVKDCPTFEDLSKEIYEYIKDCDLSGYNVNNFDLPMLMEELLRANIFYNIRNVKVVDVQVLYHKMESRTLSAAYKFYCKKDLENAHSAEADTKATYEILKSQLSHYENTEYKDFNGNICVPVKNDVDSLSEFTTQNKKVDLAGHFIYDEKNEIIFNFGKYKGQSVKKIIAEIPAYYSWIINADFPAYTKMVLKVIKEDN